MPRSEHLAIIRRLSLLAGWGVVLVSCCPNEVGKAWDRVALEDASAGCMQAALCPEVEAPVDCRFECVEVSPEGRIGTRSLAGPLSAAIETCKKGTVRAESLTDQERCSLGSAQAIAELERPELSIELEHTVAQEGLSFTDTKLRSLLLVDTIVEGPLKLDNWVVAESIRLDQVDVCSSLSIDGTSADELEIEYSEVLDGLSLSKFAAAKDLGLTNDVICGGVDAARTRAGGLFNLSETTFLAPGSNLISKDDGGADFQFPEIRADTLSVTHAKFVGSTNFNLARSDKDISFVGSRFHGSVTAGAMVAGGGISFAGSVFAGSEKNTNPWYRPTDLGCTDQGQGTSVELYRTQATVLDMRGVIAPRRVLNLNESAVSRLDLGQSKLCGLLVAASKTEVLNIDEPETSVSTTAIADTDARGFVFDRLVSRSGDPVGMTYQALGTIKGSREVFIRLSSQLHDSGEIEGANRAYRIARDTEAARDTGWYVYWLTGDGRYPLSTYALAYGALYVLALISFWHRPVRWLTERKGVPYSAAWFALDVVTPGLLDLGYRGVEVFGPNKVRTWLHSAFHAVGVLVLALIVIAIGVRLP